MASKDPMTQLYSRLGSSGFPRKYLRDVVLPAWWEDEIAHIRLASRVLCLEQIIKRVIGVVGFAPVKDKVVRAKTCDTALRAVFGSGADATEANVRTGLDSYINELRSLRVNLLVP